MNRLVSGILRGGVIASAAVVALGLALYLITGRTGYEAAGQGLAGLIQLGNGATFPVSIWEAIRGVIALKPFAIIQLGLLLLIITPVVRVASSVVAFAIERDRVYVAITLFVFVVLVISFFLGMA